jgi:hypothetical protein
MNPLIIEQTKYSPRVELNPNGEIYIQGRSIIEDPFTFYNPILSWARNTTFSALNVKIKLEYLNTSSSIQIYNLLNIIQENNIGEKVIISWYYEEGDEDTYDLGKEFASQISLPFEFFEYSETAA